MGGSGDYVNKEKVYEDMTNAAALKQKTVDLLVENNNSPGVVRMDLVLFLDAIDHGICRVGEKTGLFLELITLCNVCGIKTCGM